MEVYKGAQNLMLRCMGEMKRIASGEAQGLEGQKECSKSCHEALDYLGVGWPEARKKLVLKDGEVASSELQVFQGMMGGFLKMFEAQSKLTDERLMQLYTLGTELFASALYKAKCNNFLFSIFVFRLPSQSFLQLLQSDAVA